MLWSRNIVVLIFAFSLVSIAGAADLDENILGKDSVQIYNNLIEEESQDASYVPNVVGMVVGGGLTGVGTFFFVGGLYAFNHKSTDAGDDVFTAIAAGAMMGLSIPFFLVGIPVLVYNVHQYKIHKSGSINSNQRQGALNKCRLNAVQDEMNSIQMMIVPILTMANPSVGANVLLLF